VLYCFWFSLVENVPFDKNSSVTVGDNLVVYYGDKQPTTYDAKVSYY